MDKELYLYVGGYGYYGEAFFMIAREKSEYFYPRALVPCCCCCCVFVGREASERVYRSCVSSERERQCPLWPFPLSHLAPEVHQYERAKITRERTRQEEDTRVWCVCVHRSGATNGTYQRNGKRRQIDYSSIRLGSVSGAL